MAGAPPFFWTEPVIQAKDHVAPRGVGFTQASILRFPEVALAPGAGSLALASAASFAVLGATTVTNTGASVVTGNLGLYPGTSIIGFPPGTVVNGTIQDTTPAAAQAQVDLTTAYTTLNALPPTGGTLAADIGGTTITPGVYNVVSTLAITGTVNLNAGGNPNALFIFQIPSTFIPAVGSTVLLTGGAQAANVYWVVGSSATINNGSTFEGNVLAEASITAGTTVTGSMRLLARTGAVTLDDTTVTIPAVGSSSNTIAARLPLPAGCKILAVEVLPYGSLAGTASFNIVEGPIAYEGAVPAQGSFLVHGSANPAGTDTLTVVINGTSVTTAAIPANTQRDQAAVILAAAINANVTLAALGTAYAIGQYNGGSVVTFVDSTAGTGGNGITTTAAASPGGPASLNVTAYAATMCGGAAAGALPVIANTDSTRAGITPPNTAVIGQALFAADQAIAMTPELVQPFYPVQYDAIFPKNASLTLRLTTSSAAAGTLSVALLVQLVDQHPEKAYRSGWVPTLSSY